MEETLTIKGIKYVVVERHPTGNYRVGESVNVVCLRRPRGQQYYYADEVLTANGYRYRLS